jgi:hypothetical protein
MKHIEELKDSAIGCLSIALYLVILAWAESHFGVDGIIVVFVLAIPSIIVLFAVLQGLLSVLSNACRKLGESSPQKTSEPSETLISKEEAAQIIGVTVPLLEDLMRRGEIEENTQSEKRPSTKAVNRYLERIKSVRESHISAEEAVEMLQVPPSLLDFLTKRWHVDCVMIPSQDGKSYERRLSRKMVQRLLEEHPESYTGEPGK